ncbi:MAG: C-terminal binding protein [Dehalococcoidia bacterium]|jgi:D-3-phosphoglycerate dehydrogenase|nr:C-terminal binding protein [Dehalococcoidia bacterium]
MAATKVCDVAITAMQPYTRRVIENMQHCRLISVIGIGYDGVDIEAATERGILVANVPDYCQEEVANHAMALILACNRKLIPIAQAVRQKAWSTPEKPEIRYNIMQKYGLPRLSGQVLGIVGLGRIGQSLVPRAKAFGMGVIAFDPFVPDAAMEHMGVEKVDLDSLLRESDYVSLHTNLTLQNRGMIGMGELKKMKSTAYIINTARGGLINEADLAQAVKECVLAGAALDVTDPEPPPHNSPLLLLDRVIITAHTAQYSNEAVADLRRGVEENVFSVLRGHLPPGLLNPQAKETHLERWPRNA